ncbi:MAG TPA: MRP family ATP-binding protein [Bacteroidetes bacterium]|nr:MRP family ATP-binding protein [Bacteroidota bacterium]
MNEANNTKNRVLELLRQVKYPGYSRDIVSFGMVKNISVENGKLKVQLAMSGVEDRVAAGLQEFVHQLLRSESGYEQVQVDLENKPAQSQKKEDKPGHSDQLLNPQPLPGVDRIIAVSSGKGGVGKSTVAVNLACTAAGRGLRVGLLDADIHGPSLPTLLGIKTKPNATKEGIIPFDKFGIKSMSIGYLIESGQPLIWRGPMLNKALEQICGETLWGNLDYLFIDLPPGTGDVQISMAQKYQISGALVVTTPQNLALEDVHRGVIMFQHTNVPVLGVVENMSYYRCPECGNVSHPFGEGGGKREAARLELPLLGTLPLDPKTMELSDRGEPIVAADPGSESAKSYLALWDNTLKRLEEMIAV